jgi:hypothetical protein
METWNAESQDTYILMLIAQCRATVLEYRSAVASVVTAQKWKRVLDLSTHIFQSYSSLSCLTGLDAR